MKRTNYRLKAINEYGKCLVCGFDDKRTLTVTNIDGKSPTDASYNGAYNDIGGEHLVICYNCKAIKKSLSS